MSPDKLMEPMMIKKGHMILLALILSIQYDWANASAPGTGGWQPNLVNSPSLPPYKDVIGAEPSAPVAAARPPPPLPYCAYPPPARPNVPAAPLPPPPASPGAFPPADPPPSIAPTVSPPTNAPPASPGAFPPASAGPPLPNAPAAPAPAPQQQQGVWCVANPTVESADVQAAMDYACGSGADCYMAAPGGPCYLPATLMAHASYAFNSYWQRTKLAGGTCDFAGAAMLITKDPSYDDCRYVYT